MKLQPQNETGQFHSGKKLRISTFAWVCVVAVFMLIGGTFAWYTLKDLNVDDASGNVMKPYYLNLQDPGSTDTEQLSIGSLLQGEVTKIVFCVDSKEAEQINRDTTTFAYDLELVHTDNLALKYEIYPLQAATEGESDFAITEDTTTYWKKSGSALTGSDVSATRHEEVGLTAASEDTSGIINRGTYTAYEGKSNGLELTVGGGSYTSQYFVLEISWSITSGFNKYEKETDMIYILAKAVQPEPVEVSQ